MSAIRKSMQTNPLAASNRAANRYGFKRAESIVSTDILDQSSIRNCGEQRVESEPDIALTSSNRATNRNGMRAESITTFSEVN